MLSAWLQEDTIIFSLIERAQFAANYAIYRPGAIPVPGGAAAYVFGLTQMPACGSCEAHNWGVQPVLEMCCIILRAQGCLAFW